MIPERCGMGCSDPLAARLVGEVVVVGVGNPMRGDDAAGCLVAQKLAGTPGLRVVEGDEVPESHLFKILSMHPDVVVLVDAVDLGAPPGSVAILEVNVLTGYEPTTHRVPLGMIAELLRNQAGADVFVLAIQPHELTLGSNLSPDVGMAVESVVELIRRTLPGRDGASVTNSSLGRETRRC